MHEPKKPQHAPLIRGGVFVSDLHLFSPRSAAAHILGQLAEFQSSERCIVLGGDIFDFRWSVQGTHHETIRAAIGWLEDLLASSGQTQIRFLPGNHDCHPDFLHQLTSLAEHEQRFRWFEHQMQIGDCVFLHGDILDARGSLAAYRKKFHHAQPQPEVNQQLYNAAVGMRLHKLVPMVRHRTELTCARIKSLIDNRPEHINAPENVARIFFGHTHVPIFGHELQNLQFYNPGAALKYMQAHPHFFEFESMTPLVSNIERDKDA